MSQRDLHGAVLRALARRDAAAEFESDAPSTLPTCTRAYTCGATLPPGISCHRHPVAGSQREVNKRVGGARAASFLCAGTGGVRDGDAQGVRLGQQLARKAFGASSRDQVAMPPWRCLLARLGLPARDRCCFSAAWGDGRHQP